MGFSWTKEQEQVIKLNNRNILVSAAAGSGKTAVLVERIIHKISSKEKPIDINRLLIVTFTKAAAAEMRERIGLAIEAQVDKEPENEHLQRQLTLIHHAQITTIDSFCMNILRNNFHRIELDPAFRVGDEGELKLLKEDVLTDLMERHYLIGDKKFCDFVDTYATGKDDSSITKLILDFYEFSRSYPWPEEWLKACGASYALHDAQSINEEEWMQFLIRQVNMQLEEYVRLYDRMIAICEGEDGPDSYLPVILQERDSIKSALGNFDYESLSKAVGFITFGRKPRKKKTDTYSEEKAALVSTLRDRVKAGVKGLIKSYFYKSIDCIYEDMIGACEAVLTLVDLTLEFAEEFKAAKQKKNVLDFGDLEHFALDILVTKNDDKMIPSDVANQYSEEFEEIMIDEYQDSNMVQEVLLNSISKERFGRPNVFMVGDVKQSIYKFRLAKPELFMEKYETYTSEDSLYQKIELHKNFRSREDVLQSVNFIFYQIMRKQLGDIDYTSECALHKGMEYEEFAGKCGGETELLLLNLDDNASEDEYELQTESTSVDRVGEEDMAAVTDREWEAKMIAARIKELTDPENGQFIYDKYLKKYRRATYKDIVILLRTMSGWSEPFVQALMNQGIPAYSESQAGYFTTIEIQTILNLLRIIDNPIQDIPLASILKSPIVNLTSEELGKIKIPYLNTGLGNGLYGAILFYLEHFKSATEDEIYPKLQIFMERLNLYRTWSSYLPLPDLLQKVLSDSGYYEYICAMPAGERRRANVDMLYEKALSFEATSYHGLFHFVRYIEKLQKFAVDFGEASTIGENDNTVRIISIHKSKGLEFPIVFLAGAGKAFNKQDSRSRIVFHPDFGIGVDYIDPKLRTKTTTLIKKVLQKKLLLENLGEELRVLYVALTRAKEKLIITGAKNRLDNWLEKTLSCTDLTDLKLSYEELSTAGCYLDLIIPALSKNRAFAPILEQFKIAAPFQGILYDDAAKYSVSLVSKDMLKASESAEKLERSIDEGQLLYWDADQVYDEEVAEEINKCFSFSYHYNSLENTYATMSVSDVKKLVSPDEENPAFELIKPMDDLETIPEFLKEKDTNNKGVIRGTAYHKFLQLLDYTGDLSERGILLQKKNWEDLGRIKEEDSNLVWIPDIVKFANTTLAKRLSRAQELGKLYREQQFIIGISPKEVCQASQGFSEGIPDNEIVMIQGVIDAYFEEDGEIVLIDYKTDYVEEENGMEVLLNRYKVQLDYYEKAIKQITGLNVKERLIYSIRLGKSISY